MAIKEAGKINFLKGLSSKEIISRIVFAAMILTLLIIGIVCVFSAIKWIDKPFSGFLFNKRIAVSSLGQSHWTGVKEGLKKHDNILKAHGRVISSAEELKEVVNNTVIGDPVAYSIERGSQAIEITIPIMRFTFADLIIHFWSFFFAGIIYLLIAVVVFILKPDTMVSWAFLFLGFFMSLFNLTGFDSMAGPYIFYRLNMFSLTFFPATFIHLSLVFPEKKKIVQRYPYLQYLPYVLSIVIVVPLEFFYPGSIFLKMYDLAHVYIVISVISLFISTIHSYLKKSSILARQRAKVVFFGTALAFPIPAAIFAFQFHFGIILNKFQIPLGFVSYALLIFPASIAYAITKHDLFDVDVYIKRTVGYAIMTIIVGLGYFSTQMLLSTFVLRPIIGEAAEQVYPVLFALLIVFFFNPLNRKIQEGVDRMFFRKKFDYRETIASVSNALTSMLNLDEIIKQLIHTVRKEMFIDTAGVILMGPQKEMCQTFFVRDEPTGDEKGQVKEMEITCDDPLLALISREKKLITKYDIAENPGYAEIKESCGQRFSEMAASLAIPLIYKEKVTGILALGHKKSGHFYNREDIDLLTTLSNQGAVAIQNARLFEENLEKGRMEEELKIAHDLQVSMLPEKPPEIEGFKFAASSIAAREVGGDFYDFIEIGREEGADKLGIVIGDVSGKGVPGSLMMAASRSIYRVLAEENPSVEKVMSIGNYCLNRDIRKGMFVALLYAVLDPKERTLTLSNAGQTQPIMCAEGNSEPFYIDTEGDKFPLGIVKDCKYEETKMTLKEGDTVVFYTDGVVEAMNEQNKMYEFDRFMASITEGRDLDAGALLKKLMDDVLRFTGDAEQHDDITIVVLKVEGRLQT